MDITHIIATNLGAWMAATPALDTLKKVAARSGVGFGTVQRARNGDGNTTIQNLTLIARAFKRAPEDLLRRPDYPQDGIVTDLPTKESPPLPPLVAELVDVAQAMSERGLIELIGRAKELQLAHPRAKAKRFNS